MFEPPYLTSGQPRPENVTLPSTSTDLLDGTYVLGNDQTGIRCVVELDGMASFDKVVLMAPAAMTHHSDMNARYVEMTSTSTSPTERVFSTPNQRVLPRGYYMLFAVSNGGIPSKAVWVRIQ